MRFIRRFTSRHFPRRQSGAKFSQSFIAHKLVGLSASAGAVWAGEVMVDVFPSRSERAGDSAEGVSGRLRAAWGQGWREVGGRLEERTRAVPGGGWMSTREVAGSGHIDDLRAKPPAPPHWQDPRPTRTCACPFMAVAQDVRPSNTQAERGTWLIRSRSTACIGEDGMPHDGRVSTADFPSCPLHPSAPWGRHVPPRLSTL